MVVPFPAQKGTTMNCKFFSCLAAASLSALLLFTGCGGSSSAASRATPIASSADNASAASTVQTEKATSTELVVRFGDGGTPFTLHLYYSLS